MGHRPQPRYFASRGAYYVQHKGKQHLLAIGPEKDKAVIDKAEKAFHSLMLVGERDQAEDNNQVIVILDAFLAYCRQEGRAPVTIKGYKFTYDKFIVDYGRLRIRELRPSHVREFIAAHPTWGPTQRNKVVTHLVAALNWARNDEMISRNPLAGMKRSKARSRGEEAVISPEEHAAMLAHASPCGQDLLTALYETGARPDEVARLSAENFDAKLSAFVLVGKTTAKTGRKRVIYCSPVMLALVHRLMAIRPTGPLLRNAWGKPWKDQAWCWQFREVRRSAGLREAITAYGYRHTLATEAIRQHADQAYVCKLLGHKDTKMLYHHYSHLLDDDPGVLECLSQVRGATPQVANQNPRSPVQLAPSAPQV